MTKRGKAEGKVVTADHPNVLTILTSSTVELSSTSKNAPTLTSGEVCCLSISARKGSRKNNVDRVSVMANFGIAGDAHAGSERQVSLLPYESFDVVRGRLPDIKPGDFAENITTRGIDFSLARVGDRLQVGGSVRLVITHVGKECHHNCLIRQAVGDCIMPRLGIFAAVIEGGMIQVGDKIRWETDRA